MAKTIIFGMISLAAFIAAAFASRTSERRWVIWVWWGAFAIGFLFQIMSLFQSWEDNQRVERLEYQDIAHYNALGNISGSVNGVPIVGTPINNWSKDFMTREDGQPIWKCNNEVKDSCSEVIHKLPLYPFSYYALALCKKESNDQSWESDAKKALSILKITAAVEDHHSDHDKVLKDVKKLLGEKHK